MAKKILLVEDDKILAQMYQDKLAVNKFDVVASYTGSDALTKVRNFHPDLILLDIMLSIGMNGFDVLRELKLNQELKKIPVIVFTNLDSEKKTALSLGAVDYFVKSETSLDNLIKLIKKHLGLW